jgi:hypothetical protein
MQALVDKVFENKSFIFVAWALALLLAAALILFIYRLAFGRRLKTPGGGRTRLPRLGVVDAFDLDRHRQLVIVRRDNVEHLLMIGGPNDLVIESEIIRAEARDVRLRDSAREKEPREAPQAPVQAPSPAASPSAPPWQQELDSAPGRISTSQPQPPRKIPVSPPAPIAPDAEPPSADELAPPPPAAPLAPRAPAFPLPPRRVVQPLAAPRTPREPPSRPDLPSKIEAGTGASGGFQRAPLATPFLRPSPPRQLADSKPSAASPYPAARSPGTSAAPASRRDGEPPAAASDVAAASDAAPARPDGVGAPAPEASAPVLSAERSDAAGPLRTPPGAPPAADKLADDVDKGPAPHAGEQALADASNLSPIDSLDNLLEEEMARLLGRGP